MLMEADLQISVFENYSSYLLTKTYVVGTQKNRLNEHPKHMFDGSFERPKHMFDR